MTGIVIVTHGQLGDALIEAAEFITGQKPEAVVAVSINIQSNADKLREKIEKKINEVKGDNGVLILTDMFGGSPSNLSYSFLEEGSIEVISGVNLPILLKAIDIRVKMPLSESVEKIVDFGKRSVSLASGILKGNKRG
ncbi:MAG: PTS fructose transporter subunit IIA [Proteobacteria bacterium]|nr:PTS fructose transporter subunit IIA [Pseudomonadota bacterium]